MERSKTKYELIDSCEVCHKCGRAPQIIDIPDGDSIITCKTCMSEVVSNNLSAAVDRWNAYEIEKTKGIPVNDRSPIKKYERELNGKIVYVLNQDEMKELLRTITNDVKEIIIKLIKEDGEEVNDESLI